MFHFDNSYKTLSPELFTECSPTKVQNPQLVVFNTGLATELGIDVEKISQSELEAIFSGNTLPENAAGIAQAYGGHQFGHFNRLGDGRAILLGEQITPNGKRFDLQYKGSGITPYSRRGDGRATLSSMLREYIISEAMFALGIPTTRSLAVVATGEAVYREQTQAGAVLTRVASSHIRVGTFEYIARFCSPKVLQQFTEYTIARHFPEIIQHENKELAFLKLVMERQIDLIVNWMRVGFIHGVMNTDNMAISGETIDYGPCAFMNAYKPETVFSSIDTSGRYAFANQASIALWNLTRLAECLIPLIDKNTEKAIESASSVLNNFQPIFEEKYLKMMASKLGISHTQDSDKQLISGLLNWMYAHEADYTNTFLKLMYPDSISDKVYEDEEFIQWNASLKLRLSLEDAEKSNALMHANNPVYIPRNHKVETVLMQVCNTGELSKLKEFVDIITQPYSQIPFNHNFMQAPPASDDKCYKTYCGT